MGGLYAPGVGTLHHAHPLIASELPIQQSIAHIHRIHLSGACAQQHIGKTAGGAANIHAHPILGVNMKHLHRFIQLMAAPAYKGIPLAAHRKLVRLLNHSGGLIRLLLKDIHPAFHDQRPGQIKIFREPALHHRLIQPNSAHCARPLLSKIAWATCSGVSPHCFSCHSRLPCSTKRSGTPRFNTGHRTLAAARTSNTMDPKPP